MPDLTTQPAKALSSDPTRQLIVNAITATLKTYDTFDRTYILEEWGFDVLKMLDGDEERLKKFKGHKGWYSKDLLTPDHVAAHLQVSHERLIELCNEDKELTELYRRLKGCTVRQLFGWQFLEKLPAAIIQFILKNLSVYKDTKEIAVTFKPEPLTDEEMLQIRKQFPSMGKVIEGELA